MFLMAITSYIVRRRTRTVGYNVVFHVIGLMAVITLCAKNNIFCEQSVEFLPVGIRLLHLPVCVKANVNAEGK